MNAGPLVIGIDGGTESLRVALFDLSGRERAVASAPYPTHFPGPGQAEQQPQHWWAALAQALPEALGKSGAQASDIRAIALDTTCCTVCFLDKDGAPVRSALLWMDVRASAEAAALLTTGDPALSINNGGKGPVSAEWMIPKASWVKTNEPHIYDRAVTICEYQDYLNFRLTSNMVASTNNSGVRWHFRHGGAGAPNTLLAALRMESLAEKWPKTMLAPGEVVGGLTPQAAAELGLRPDTPVVQGGADAFIAMAGMGVVRPGQLALVTGSSHLQLALTGQAVHGEGIWGSYADVLRRGLSVVEGGQTSTGSVINWFRRQLAPSASYRELDSEAAAIAPGCEGLSAQDHFQGNRTPYTDARSRGAFIGLSLNHGRGHMFRALLESVAYGTRLILDTMRERQIAVDDIMLCGGVARSPLWAQIHADILDTPIRISPAASAPALGSAMFAAIGAAHFADLDEAAAAMVAPGRIVEPDRQAVAAYADPFARYRATYGALRPLTAA